MYIRLLRTACRDYKRKIPKSDLIKRCKRATPCEWVKYLTASRVMKILREKQPKFLYYNTTSNYYEEQRKPKWGKFFDSSKNVVG